MISTKRLICIVFICCLSAFIGAIQFIMLFLRSEDESLAQFGHLLNNPIWIDPVTGKLPKFVANSFGNFWFSFELIGVGIVAILSYSLAIYFGVKIYYKLKSMQNLMSPRTIRLQRSMTVILIIKGWFLISYFEL